MTFDVTFDLDPMTLEVGFGELYDVSDGEADRIYQDGYDAGETAGKEAGYTEGYTAGNTDGYAKGRTAGYAEGAAAEQAVTDGILDRSISGAYRNERVTSIGTYMFYKCGGLTAVDFPKATSIGAYAFYDCSGLTEADFPLVTSIGAYMFYKCGGLTAVDFPKATSIGTYAFHGCSGLTEVDFPLVTSITTYAFGNCKALEKLILRNTSKVCTLNSTTALSNTPIKSGTGYIYVPDDLVDSYKAATNWSTFADQIKPLSELEE